VKEKLEEAMKKRTVLFIVFTLLIALFIFSACGKKTTEPEKQVTKPTFSPPAGTYTSQQDVSISCATEDAIIKYTIDGTEPGENSLVYVSPIQVEASKTLIAKAFKSGWIDSDAVISEYNITGMVATPLFYPPAGSYNTPQAVTISCVSEDAVIYYTIDGSDPSEVSSLYSAPLVINANTTLKARAFKSEWDESEIAIGEYSLTVISPAFNPPAGIYNIPQLITISCLTDAVLIYYTTDNSEPNETSSLYTVPIEINANTNLKARAFKSDWDESEISTAEYTFTVISPTFDPPAGIYNIPQLITINCFSENALIYYTTDGSEPNETSSLYTNPIEVSTILLIKAKAYKSNWTDSQVITAQYAIDGATGTVTDIDGNVYQTLVIGNQEWLVENLKVTHYRNGDPIHNVTDNNEWAGLSTGAYCYFDNNTSNGDTYGTLYNWYAVADSPGLAPEGFKVANDQDFMELEMYLGMSESEANSMGWRGTNEGSKLAGGYDLWQNGVLRNDPEFDTSGFSLLPSGFRNNDGSFHYMSSQGFLWSTTELNTVLALVRGLININTTVIRGNSNKQIGISVRCLRDLE
jgi:uncharacterized protein (TIGR02145 family)